MERYYSYSGRSNPEFVHRVAIQEVSDDMLNWCSTYSGKHPSSRWFIQWNPAYRSSAIFQFESEESALVFSLKFGHR